MKKIILLSAIVFCISCKKVSTNYAALPWNFTLNDNGKSYNYDCEEADSVYTNSNPFFRFTTDINNAGSYSLSVQANVAFPASNSTAISITFIGTDSLIYKRLLKQNTKTIKETALKDIFIPGKIILPLGNSTVNTQFNCGYTFGTNPYYFLNFFNPAPTDQLKIISSEIINDNSSLAKLKVNFQYDVVVQEWANSQFLPNGRHITGTMKTMFFVP